MTRNTTKTTPIRPDATLLIQQPCARCNGSGSDEAGAICYECYGTRRVTLHITLDELGETLAALAISSRHRKAASGY